MRMPKIPFLRGRKSGQASTPRPKKQKRIPATPKDERRLRQNDYLRRISERRKALR
jgi:hypothetical protein